MNYILKYGEVRFCHYKPLNRWGGIIDYTRKYSKPRNVNVGSVFDTCVCDKIFLDILTTGAGTSQLIADILIK